jgi:aryl-alcohol dehydrogenase-like predicted oxidoreductase
MTATAEQFTATVPPASRHVTAPLGFGCSQLMGPKTRDEAYRLLAAAYDAGIRHFDVARSYGCGDAEGVLGEFLRGRRDTVTITSKFGIQPPKFASKQRFIVQTARRVMRFAPFVRKAISRRAANMVVRGQFSVEEARKSLETSLQALRTDCIDVYLLHDCQPEDCKDAALLAFLEGAVKSGKIGSFGVGTKAEPAAAIIDSSAQFAHVVQFDNSVFSQTASKVPVSGDRRILTHGALVGFHGLRGHLDAHPARAADWSKDLGVDCRDPNALAALMLNYAAHSTNGATVIFSSTSAANIARNASALRESSFSAAQLDRFAAHVAKVEI